MLNFKSSRHIEQINDLTNSIKLLRPKQQIRCLAWMRQISEYDWMSRKTDWKELADFYASIFKLSISEILAEQNSLPTSLR